MILLMWGWICIALPLVSALYADQVGQFDWVQHNVGHVKGAIVQVIHFNFIDFIMDA